MKNRDNYETREINLTYQDPYNPITYNDVEPFGWVEMEVVTVGMSEYSILERNKKMPNYRRIKQLDEKYFELSKMKIDGMQVVGFCGHCCQVTEGSKKSLAKL